MIATVPRSRYWMFGCLAVGALAWDLVSKSLVFSALGYPYRQSEWCWSFPCLWGRFSLQFTTSFNQGALFGMGQGLGWLFALLSVGAGAFLLYWLFVRGEARSWWLTVALALVLAGTLGNLYDRLYLHACQTGDGQPLYGVRDFLDCRFPWFGWDPDRGRIVAVPEWPWYIFNFADTYLVTGAIMLTLYSFRSPAEQRHDGAAPASATSPPAGTESGDAPQPRAALRSPPAA